LYWVTEPVLGGYAEKEDGTFVESLHVFSSRAAANEYVRHNYGSARAARCVSERDLIEIIETSSIDREFSSVVVNPVPADPEGSCPEDVRPLTKFLEGLQGSV